MTVTADHAEGQRGLAAKLGLKTGHTVQEVGYDDDCDPAVRAAVVAATGSEPVGEDHEDFVDVLVLWWRDEGDLVDALFDAIGRLNDQGTVWLMTPKPGRPGHVDAEDIVEAAPTAGLQPTSTVSATKDWQGTRLVAPRAARRGPSGR